MLKNTLLTMEVLMHNFFVLLPYPAMISLLVCSAAQVYDSEFFSIFSNDKTRAGLATLLERVNKQIFKVNLKIFFFSF